MKKIFLLAIFVFGALISNAQTWKIETYNDSFGDPTEEKFAVVTHEDGKFSNSATFGSDLITFTKYDKTRPALTIYLFEYGSHKANFKSNLDGKLLIKDDDGKIHTLNCYQGEDGYLYFSDENFVPLNNLLIKNNKLRCVYTEVSEYSKSKYKFNISGSGYITAKKKVDNQS